MSTAAAKRKRVDSPKVQRDGKNKSVVNIASTTSSKSNKISSSNNSNNNNKSSKGGGGDDTTTTAPTGYILECDPPVKQFVQYNDSTKHDDKKWVIEDLDDRHLLINRKYKNEIIRKVEEWMDANVFSSVDRVGEDLDVS